MREIAKKHAIKIARELNRGGVIKQVLAARGLPVVGRSALEKLVGSNSFSDISYADDIIASVQQMVTESAQRQTEKIRQLVTEMDNNGESLTDIRAKIKDLIGTRSSWRKGLAKAVATSTIEGTKDSVLKECGSFITRQWNAVEDERTRPSHWKADGQTRVGERPFNVGGYPMKHPGDLSAPIHETANCFPADTIVDGVIDGAYRREYTGLMIEVTTRKGKKLTGTPNHPILTDKGWIPLQLLIKGDNLLCYERDIESTIGHDIQTSPTQIGKVFDSLVMSHDVMRIPASRVNFHSEISDSDVNIVFVDGKLNVDLQTQADKFVSKFSFPSSNMVGGKFFTFGSDDKRSLSIFTSPSSGDGISSQNDSFSPIHSIHSGVHRLTTTPDGHIIFDKESSESGSTNTTFVGEEILGFSCDISLDDVVSIRRIEGWSGHVYNLSTKTGAYTSNGIIAHNCRCFLTWSPSGGK